MTDNLKTERDELRRYVLLADIAELLGCEPDAPISSVLENMSAEDRARVDAFVAARKAEWQAEDLRGGDVMGAA